MSTFDSFEVEVEDPKGTNRSYGTDDEKGLYKLNLEYKKAPRKKKMLDWWEKYGEKIILAIGIILIAAVSFEAGFLQGRKNKEESVVVNKTAYAPCPKEEKNSQANSAPSSQQNNSAATNKENSEEPQKCAYVASKNSNKYHLSSCPWAQKIKPENRICFPSAEEAQKRGYQGAKCCIK